MVANCWAWKLSVARRDETKVQLHMWGTKVMLKLTLLHS